MFLSPFGLSERVPVPPVLDEQPRFRSLWERYCRGVQAIVYVVDAADYDNVVLSTTELQVSLRLCMAFIYTLL